ncbi:MAG: glycerol kinase, partial [Leptolyngbya sp. SIO4C1]|nr:glycerol kinase [Leptolyngbya sp. SIO4C1]
TAQGSAFAAGLAVGLWDSYADLVAQRQIDCVFEPASSAAQAQFETWQAAVARAKNWAT